MWPSWLIVLALLVAIAVVTGGEDAQEGAERAERAPEAAEPAPVEVIARRVERIRGVRFEERPRPERVTADQARDEGLEALDRDYAPVRRRADEKLYALLGLLPEDTDLREVAESVYGSQVAGYYDPRTGALRIVEGAGMSSPAYTEIILAHELTHALEDQVFGLRMEEITGTGDAALAYAALVEGTATALMFDYASRHLTGEELLGGLLASAFAPPPDIPPFLQAQLLFPYDRGQAFAQRLYRATGDWTLLDVALRHRPPATTEQVLHPEKYLRFEGPERVRVEPRAVLGGGWRRAAAGTLGEWQTGELLREAGGTGAPAAAEGWGGDRYELWSGPGGDALVVRWRWDTPADRREFAAKLRAYVDAGAPGGVAALARRGGAVTLAVAPDRALARRLARAPG
jgi:hypothetical protein